MQRIRDFCSANFRSDSRAFALEMTSFGFTVVASFMMAFTAAQPDLRIIYPIFFIGSLAGCWAYVRRRLAWPVMLTAYFMLINVYGFGRAVFWW